MKVRWSRMPELAFFGLGLGLLWLAGAWEGRPGRDFELVPSPGLRVVTWNVGENVLSNAKRGGSPLSADAEGAVIETLRALDADVVALQELSGTAQLDRIAAGLGVETKVVVGQGHGRLVGVIARRGIVPWDGQDPAREERYGIDLDLRHPSGRRLAVRVLHASAWRAEARNRLIGAAVEALLAREADVRILAGDLNLDVDPGARRDIFSDRAHLDVQTYAFLTGQMQDAGLGSGPTAEPDRRLDYVFFAGPALELESCAPWRGRREGKMDHHPLVADWSWTAPKTSR